MRTMRLSFKKLGIGASLVFCLMGMAVTLSISDPISAHENSVLSAKHEKIMQDFPNVAHISSDELQQLETSNALIFDIRDTDEYSVSHMAGAILISPKTSASEFLEKYSKAAKGKTVIFYCSVGQRSSLFATRVQYSLKTSGAAAVFNLKGGLFNWHNENLPLVTPSKDPTEYIHPYNQFWGRMLNHKDKTSYESEDSAVDL